jgi:hypothetical protein
MGSWVGHGVKVSVEYTVRAITCSPLLFSLRAALVRKLVCLVEGTLMAEERCRIGKLRTIKLG